MSLNIFLYIDPGTGSILISTIIGIALTVLFSIKGLFYKLLAQTTGRSVKQNNDFSGKLVIFSEGKNYAKVFTPLINDLIRRQQHFVYLSAGQDDPVLAIQSKFCESYYIGPLQQGIIFLNSLKAQMCVMTTPQLNILTLKRSKYVEHYCHIIHSPTDIHAYKKFAFDYFDSVLCSSSYQIKHLRQLEEERKSPQKMLLKTGCTYLDYNAKESPSQGDAILLAPTWGEKSFFEKYGKDIIKNLLDNGHKIIYRPHPQSWISDLKLVEDIIKQYADKPNFRVDKEVDNSTSLSHSMLMICDMSGVVYDYVFTQKKPVIAVDFKWDDGGYESSDIKAPSSTTFLLSDVGQFIQPEECPNINTIVKRVLELNISDKIIDKHIFNYGCATGIASQQILDIFNGIDQH